MDLFQCSHFCSPQAPTTAIQMVRLLKALKGESPSHQIYPKVSRKKSGPYRLIPRALWLQICSKQYQREHLFHVEYSSVIPLTAVDCFSTGENKVVVQEMGRERESSSCLKRSSEVLGPSSPSAAVLDSDLPIRDNLERRSSLEGNIFYLQLKYYLTITFTVLKITKMGHFHWHL